MALTDQQVLATQTAAIMEKVQKLIDAAIPRFTPGTVEAFAPDSATVQVKVDGDPDGQFTPMSDLTGATLVPGQRVMVIFIPPSGAFVLGLITQPNKAGISSGWSALNVADTRSIDAGTASPTTNREVTATMIVELIRLGIFGP